MRVIPFPVFDYFAQNALKRWFTHEIFASYRKSGVAEFIFGDKFASGSRINVFTAYVQTLSSQKSPKMVSRARSDRLYGKTGTLNSNMTSDFKP